MTAVPATTGASNNAATNQINASLGSLANNYQTFLSLLTTQLKNQDPLSPLDTNQFTQQLTQMTGVEQQLLGNQLLQQLVSEQGGLNQGAAMIGKVITAPGAKDTDPNITGVVSAVQIVDGKTMLTVGSNQVDLSTVTGVAANPNNPLSGLFGS
jgi:flagellar hook assembly protein FlgD